MGLARPALAVVRPVSQADLPAASSGGRAPPLDPSRSARFFGRRDDGDGMAQVRHPYARGALAQAVRHVRLTKLWGHRARLR